MTLYDCPACGLPATVDSRGHAPSTHGAIEHVQVRCAAGDWFLGPAETLRVRLPMPDDLV
ncbi:MAG: hypothetical protein ACRDTU_05275 [Micromonosporaceae bacterium]